MEILLEGSCRLFQKLRHLAWTKTKDKKRPLQQEQKMEMEDKDIRPRQLLVECKAPADHIVIQKMYLRQHYVSI